MPSDSKSKRAASAKPAASKTPLKHHRGGMFSMDSEQSARMVIFGVTAVVLVAAAAFIAIGYYVSVIRPRGRTVLQVEQVTVSYSDMKRRMAYEYGANQAFQNPQAVVSLPAVAYRNLREELTLVTRAESDLGVTIDDAEVENALRTKIGAPENADDEAFADPFRRALSASRLHEDEYRRVVRAEVLQQKVRDKLNESTPATVPQAKVEVIAAEERAEVEAAIARVTAGEPWADVAKAVSLEGDAEQTGGVKAFNYEGTLAPAYDTFAFSAPVGEISTPLQDPGGAGPFYAVRVIERVEMPLTETQKTAFQTKQYDDWLEDTQAKMTIIDRWTTDTKGQASAVEPLFRDAQAKLRQQVEEQQRLPTIQVPTAAAATAVEGTPPGGTPAAETPVPGTPASAGASTPAATVPADGQ